MTPQKKHNDYDDECTVTTVMTTDSSFVSIVATQTGGRKRRLRFSDTMLVIPTLHVSDMSEREVEATWYSQNDYDAIKNKSSPIVRKMTMGERVESRSETSRGLERKTKSGSFNRKRNKFIGICSVIVEQKRQESLKIHDPVLLARVYHEATSSCQDDAHAAGLKDQAVVQWELEKMRRKLGKSSPKKQTKGAPSKTSLVTPPADLNVVSTIC